MATLADLSSSSATADFLPSVQSVVEELIPKDFKALPKTAFVTRALTTKVPVYYVSDATPDRTRRIVLAMLTLCGRAEDQRPQCWQTFVITFALVCFPEIVPILRNDTTNVDYDYQEFSKDFIDQCESAATAQTQTETAGTRYVQFPPGLPNASTIAPTPELIEASLIEGLYGYYSMLVFIMGKSIGTENLVSLATKRPSALIRKRMIQQCEYLLTGEGRPATGNYKLIQSGWVRSTKPRIAIVMHHARLVASSNRSESLDVLMINMDMLRNSGQTYIFYIHELLVACPWCIKLPALRSAFYHYVKMVKALHAQEEWFQPYFKLAMQDSTKEVRRKDIESLIGVAAFFAAQTRQTMGQYRINKDVYPVINQFRALAEKEGIIFHEVEQQTTETTAT